MVFGPALVCGWVNFPILWPHTPVQMKLKCPPPPGAIAVENDLILNMTQKIRSKNFQKCSKVGYHSCLSCQLDALVACAELFQAHVCCFSSTSNLSITVNENFYPPCTFVKSVKAKVKSFKN